MIVTKQARAEVRWPIASHQPASRNQMTLPTSPSGPVPRSAWPVISARLRASRPNGHSEKFPITKHDRAQGRPTIVIAATRPASHQPSAITRPPQTTQITFSRKRNTPAASKEPQRRQSGPGQPGRSTAQLGGAAPGT